MEHFLVLNCDIGIIFCIFEKIRDEFCCQVTFFLRIELCTSAKNDNVIAIFMLYSNNKLNDKPRVFLLKS